MLPFLLFSLSRSLQPIPTRCQPRSPPIPWRTISANIPNFSIRTFNKMSTPIRSSSGDRRRLPRQPRCQRRANAKRQHRLILQALSRRPRLFHVPHRRSHQRHRQRWSQFHLHRTRSRRPAAAAERLSQRVRPKNERNLSSSIAHLESSDLLETDDDDLWAHVFGGFLFSLIKDRLCLVVPATSTEESSQRMSSTTAHSLNQVRSPTEIAFLPHIQRPFS